MKRLFLSGFMALAVLCLIPSCQKKDKAGDYTLKEGVLTIGMEIGYPPFEYYSESDGTTPEGFDVSMGSAIAEKLGLKAEFVNNDWAGIFAGLDTKKYDCIMSAVTKTPEREKAFNFTKPYIQNAQALVLLKDGGVQAKSPLELTGLQVAYQAETTSDIYMTKLAEDGLDFKPFEYDKIINCFDELKLKRVDAIVCDNVVAYYYIKKYGDLFEIVWEGPTDETFAICVKKGNDVLTEKLDEALDELFADNVIKNISMNIFDADLVSATRAAPAQTAPAQ